MSGPVRLMVMDRAFGDSTLKRVLDRLAWAADDDGTAVKIPIQTVADDCEISARTVQRVTRQLERAGLLVKEAEASRHDPRLYRIDLDRLGDYPLTATGAGRQARRAGIDARSTAEPEAPQGAGRSRGDRVSPLGENAPEPGVTSTASRGDIHDLRGDIHDPPIEDTLKNTEDTQTRARDGRPCGAAADAPAPGGDPEPEPAPPGPPPAIAVWRDHAEAIAASPAAPLAAFCIPDSDDGTDLVLAVMTPGVGYAVLEHAAPILGPLLDRSIFCAVRPWVGPALAERGVIGRRQYDGAGAPAGPVRLCDPAWQTWERLRARPEIAALPETRRLMVDRIHDGVLHLKAASVEVMLAIGAEKAAALSAAAAPLEVAVGWGGAWVERAIAVREALVREMAE